MELSKLWVPSPIRPSVTYRTICHDERTKGHLFQLYLWKPDRIRIYLTNLFHDSTMASNESHLFSSLPLENTSHEIFQVFLRSPHTITVSGAEADLREIHKFIEDYYWILQQDNRFAGIPKWTRRENSTEDLPQQLKWPRSFRPSSKDVCPTGKRDGKLGKSCRSRCVSPIILSALFTSNIQPWTSCSGTQGGRSIFAFRNTRKIPCRLSLFSL